MALALLTACATVPQGDLHSPYVTVTGVYTHYQGKSYRPSAIADVYSKAGALEAAKLARQAQSVYDNGRHPDGNDVAWMIGLTALIVFAILATQGSAGALLDPLAHPGPSWGPASQRETDARKRSEHLVLEAADLYNARLAYRP